MIFNIIPMRWQWKRLGHMTYRCGKGINQSMSHVSDSAMHLKFLVLKIFTKHSRSSKQNWNKKNSWFDEQVYWKSSYVYP